MNISIKHNHGEDFGTLIVVFGKDDNATLSASYGQPRLEVPLYGYEARELRDVLRSLAGDNEL
jgi:hypothetical protein